MKIRFIQFIVLFSFYIYSDLSAQEKENHPNIIFYLADDQDLLDYGAYGNPKVYTPAVDEISKEGIRFNNFYTSQAICAPSRSQIFTGMFPVKNGCMANHLPVKSDLKTVIDYMGEAGYDVVLAGKGHVKPNSVFRWSKYFKSIDHRYLPIEEIDKFLDNTDKPFCLFIASDFPHGPYPKNSKYTKEDIYKLPYDKGNFKNFKKGYYQNIYNDNLQLEKVLQMIKSKGLKDNSVFIYASDHGISGKWGVSEQGLKVPFVVRWPGVIKPNTVSNTMLSFVDVLPTLLDIAGVVDIPNDIDGKSFKKTLKGDESQVHEYIYSLATKQNIQNCKVFPSRAVRNKKYKFIRNYNSMEVVNSNLGENPVINHFIKIGAESFPNVPYEELYDLELDPYQQNNLIDNINLIDVKNELINALNSWMIEQGDFLLKGKMPLIKPTLHPLDRVSNWNKVDGNYIDKLSESDYTVKHY